MRLDGVHGEEELASDLTLREIGRQEPQDRELRGGRRLDELRGAGTRLLELTLHVVDETCQPCDARERVEVLARGFELRRREREPAPLDAGHRENEERVRVVEASIPGAPENLRRFELALGLLRPSELQQGLAESVMRDSRRPGAGESELFRLEHRVSRRGLRRLPMARLALEQSPHRMRVGETVQLSRCIGQGDGLFHRRAGGGGVAAEVAGVREDGERDDEQVGDAARASSMQRVA